MDTSGLEVTAEALPATVVLTCLVGTQDTSIHSLQRHRVGEANNTDLLQEPLCGGSLDDPPTWSHGTCVAPPSTSHREACKVIASWCKASHLHTNIVESCPFVHAQGAPWQLGLASDLLDPFGSWTRVD